MSRQRTPLDERNLIINPNWIENQVKWRNRVEQAPIPFVTPPIEDSAEYLLGEAAELHAAVHKDIRTTNPRNPGSKRGNIADEMGDVLLMLGTVATQLGVTQLNSVHAIGHDPLKITRKILGICLNLRETVEDMNVPFLVRKLDIVFSLIILLANILEIDLDAALQATYQKIETTRIGL